MTETFGAQSRSRPPRPTDAELEILGVLWHRGPSTVREVQKEIAAARPAGQAAGYTTVLKLLQIMTEKRLVERDESRRAHVYRARRAAAETQGLLVGDLADRAFGGSAAHLALRALSSRPTSREELDEIRRLLDTLEAARDRDSGTTEGDER